MFALEVRDTASEGAVSGTIPVLLAGAMVEIVDKVMRPEKEERVGNGLARDGE
jgi:hypothetical protein